MSAFLCENLKNLLAAGDSAPHTPGFAPLCQILGNGNSDKEKPLDSGNSDKEKKFNKYIGLMFMPESVNMTYTEVP